MSELSIKSDMKVFVILLLAIAACGKFEVKVETFVQKFKTKLS